MPLLQVLLRHDANMRPFLALVDSGAIDCIFPASVGAILGIDVPSGRPHKFYGLAKQEAQGFMHSVQLQVTGFDQWIEIEAGLYLARSYRSWVNLVSLKTIKWFSNTSGVSLR
jgi:hypothetical protein